MVLQTLFIAAIGAIVTYALYRWELRNIVALIAEKADWRAPPSTESSWAPSSPPSATSARRSCSS